MSLKGYTLQQGVNDKKQKSLSDLIDWCLMPRVAIRSEQ